MLMALQLMHEPFVLCADLRKGNMPLKWRAGRAASREDEPSLLDYTWEQKY